MSSLSEKMLDALNEQLNWELYSAYIYLSMSAYFESTGLRGFANWMRVQWQEELTHAMKFFDYINERGGRVRLKTIQEPKNDWNSPLEAFEEAYNHEVGVTKRIHNLAEMAFAEKDFATYNFLQWFISEQVEEESSTLEIVEKLRLIGDDKRALLFLDQELGKRQFTPPAENGGGE